MPGGKANNRSDGTPKRQVTIAIRVDRRLCASLCVWAKGHWTSPPPLSTLIRACLLVVLEDVGARQPVLPETTDINKAEAFLERYASIASGDTDIEAAVTMFRAAFGQGGPTDEELEDAENLLMSVLEEDKKEEQL